MSRLLPRHFFYYCQYLVGRAVVGMLLALPRRTGRWLACRLGDVAWLLDRRRRRRRSQENVLRAFPKMRPREAAGVVRRVYRNLVASALDALHLLRLARLGRDADVVEWDGLERLLELKGETGIVFVTAHFGAWEALGVAGPRAGFPVWTMGRGLRNVYGDAYLTALREATGQRMLPKHGALLKMLRLLRRGENVAFLIDQDASKEGVFVDFFGRPASTSPAPATLAIRTGTPLAFVYARLLPETGKFRICVGDVVWPRPGADQRAEVLRITQLLTAELERIVRKHPDEWLWLHRRWKTFPGKVTKSARINGWHRTPMPIAIPRELRAPQSR